MDLPTSAIDEYIAVNNALIDTSAHASAHIIFRHGTVVILDYEPLSTDALPFTRAYIESWPVDRLDTIGDLPDHIADAAVHYSTACAKWGTAFTYAGTTGLIGSPYPESGPAATRTISTTASGQLHIVAYPLDDAQILNLIDGSVNHEIALVLGAECRRLDWMFPQIVEIIRLL